MFAPCGINILRLLSATHHPSHSLSVVFIESFLVIVLQIIVIELFSLPMPHGHRPNLHQQPSESGGGNPSTQWDGAAPTTPNMPPNQAPTVPSTTLEQAPPPHRAQPARVGRAVRQPINDEMESFNLDISDGDSSSSQEYIPLSRVSNTPVVTASSTADTLAAAPQFAKYAIADNQSINVIEIECKEFRDLLLLL
ncbi:hypothetical protein PILCRDRAFT_89347 [Piloderma croceum F 1598]|uniref:Uncharacterized protein n=1 Tax=Piloderma croceum (strain F 1598) TaxID=765440 RepID=A0A0C3B4H6_PILCF|nr:hypothetical protein PILCRDRAFT_89347 [Piloderma croceum F 1598]